SSRRRHTRFSRDWSSDVCSSDLGGEFPVPVAQDDGKVSIEFKPFGVGLGYTPIVLSEGRISLQLSVEVSELSTQGGFQSSSGVKIGRASCRERGKTWAGAVEGEG